MVRFVWTLSWQGGSWFTPVHQRLMYQVYDCKDPRRWKCRRSIDMIGGSNLRYVRGEPSLAQFTTNCLPGCMFRVVSGTPILKWKVYYVFFPLLSPMALRFPWPLSPLSQPCVPPPVYVDGQTRTPIAERRKTARGTPTQSVIVAVQNRSWSQVFLSWTKCDHPSIKLPGDHPASMKKANRWISQGKITSRTYK